MALEVIGLGMLAPYFGTALAVQTNVIGVVLASLSHWVPHLVASGQTGGLVPDESPFVIFYIRTVDWACISI